MREKTRADFQTYSLWEAATLAIKSYVPWEVDYMSADECVTMNQTLLAIAERALHWLKDERAGYVVNEIR